MAERVNPLKLNALQLRTLVILQELARTPGIGAPQEDGSVVITALPHAHGDHLHVGAAMVSARDASGLGNPAVWGALERKGLLVAGPDGKPALTALAVGYVSGIDSEVLHRGGHH